MAASTVARACFASTTVGRSAVPARALHRRMPLRNFFGGLFGGGKNEKREGKNSDLLKWARQAGTMLAPASPPEGLEIATVAGGCFWGLELAYQRLPGVVKTSVGYTAGQVPNPTYEAVCSGRTGHTEAVQVGWGWGGGGWGWVGGNGLPSVLLKYA